MSKRYASETEVPATKSKQVIETLLKAHGASEYHTGWNPTHDIVEFGWKGKQIRFVLPRPTAESVQLTPSGYLRTGRQVTLALEQADRQRWRGLYLVIRAKLEAIEAGISIFEQEFMAFIVTGDNRTIGEILLPRIAAGSFDVNRALPETAGESRP